MDEVEESGQSVAAGGRGGDRELQWSGWGYRGQHGSGWVAVGQARPDKAGTEEGRTGGSVVREVVTTARAPRITCITTTPRRASQPQPTFSYNGAQSFSYQQPPVFCIMTPSPLSLCPINTVIVQHSYDTTRRARTIIPICSVLDFRYQSRKG
ncbi:hypothetical protein Pcinc_008345 [Petrolisthes cinctipes]|uniref:Uncharacterized protein n=1 Tax=Petrolisthes cinctipes TaxID=88211 RepID=A0AAE1G9L0_PETCI|nr:hypothetical protein Pcinc_008345 [Petrolisthes cinctipes]